MDLQQIMALHLINLTFARDRSGRICVRAGALWMGPTLQTQAEEMGRAGAFAEMEALLMRAVWRYSGKLGGLARGAGVDFLLRDLCVEMGPAAANRVVQRALGVAEDGIVTAELRRVLAGAELEPAPLLRALDRARRAAGGDVGRARGALRVAQALSPRATQGPRAARTAPGSRRAPAKAQPLTDAVGG